MKVESGWVFSFIDCISLICLIDPYRSIDRPSIIRFDSFWFRFLDLDALILIDDSFWLVFLFSCFIVSLFSSTYWFRSIFLHSSVSTYPFWFISFDLIKEGSSSAGADSQGAYSRVFNYDRLIHFDWPVVIDWFLSTGRDWLILIDWWWLVDFDSGGGLPLYSSGQVIQSSRGQTNSSAVRFPIQFVALCLGILYWLCKMHWEDH